MPLQRSEARLNHRESLSAKSLHSFETTLKATSVQTFTNRRQWEGP
jgi:hypothetical protein